MSDGPATRSANASWGVALGVVAATTWPVIGLASLPLGALAAGIGIVAFRQGVRWRAIAAIGCGLVPVVWFIFYYLAVAFGWGEYGA